MMYRAIVQHRTFDAMRKVKSGLKVETKLFGTRFSDGITKGRMR
jgi:hypothetical protein